MEREVTDIDVFIRTLFEHGNASEWYFIDGRPGLDLAYGRDSSGLGRPDLLNVTQNVNVDVPVIAIGGFHWADSLRGIVRELPGFDLQHGHGDRDHRGVLPSRRGLRCG